MPPHWFKSEARALKSVCKSSEHCQTKCRELPHFPEFFWFFSTPRVEKLAEPLSFSADVENTQASAGGDCILHTCKVWGQQTLQQTPTSVEFSTWFHSEGSDRFRPQRAEFRTAFPNSPSPFSG